MKHEEFYKAIEESLNGMVENQQRSSERVPRTTMPPRHDDADDQHDIVEVTDLDALANEDNNPLTEDELEAAESTIGNVGIDVLAFYKSFRFKNENPYRGKWGIFLIDRAINVVTEHFRLNAPATPIPELRNLALAMLLAHERYHFWCDTWALQHESLSNYCYPFKRYEYYLACKARVRNTGADIEESLSNHYAYATASKIKLSGGASSSSLVSDFFLGCPEPYCNFQASTSERNRYESLLAQSIAWGFDSATTRCSLPTIWPSLTGGIRPIESKHPIFGFESCPVWRLYVGSPTKWFSHFTGPHRKEVEKYLVNYLQGQKTVTDHTYYKIDNSEKIKYPNPHEDHLKPREFDNIIKKAGMKSADYRKERARTRKFTKRCPRSKPLPSLLKKH